jgi:hypothetical protein
MTGKNKRMTLKCLYSEIETLKDKLAEMNGMEKRVQQLETRIKEFEKVDTRDIPKIVDIPQNHWKSRQNHNLKPDIKRQNEEDLTLLKCKMCDNKFKKFCDLELHIKRKHENHDEFECDQCKKKFVTNWRLRKHMTNHSVKVKKYCHYFNNSKECPFEDLGCKFLHILSGKCKYSQICDNNLCSYQHDKNEIVIDEKVDMERSEIVENLENIHRNVSQCCSDVEEGTGKISSFYTSTPKKSIDRCEKCFERSECVDCIVKHMIGRHEDSKTLF